MATAATFVISRREIPNWDRRELLRLTDGAYYSVPVLLPDEPAIRAQADALGKWCGVMRELRF